MKNKTIKTILTGRAAYGVYVVLFVAILAITLTSIRGGIDEQDTSQTAPEARTVETISVSSYGAGSQGSAVKAAGDAYLIRAEAAGRVTRIAAKGNVLAGTVIAELENSSQRAAVTQAQGVYEAAVAAAGGNATSQSTAKQDAVRTWNTATAQTSNLMHTNIDYYFTESRTSNNIIGFRNMNAFGEAVTLNKRRLALEETIKGWEAHVSTISEANIVENIAILDRELATIATFIDEIAALVPQQHIDSTYTESMQQADFTRLSGAQTSITTIRRSIDTARTTMLNSSGSNAAASNASVKQALGILQAAQSAYNKTLVKTPVAGTITSQSIKLGDIVNIGDDIARITADEKSATVATTFTLPLTAVKYTPAGGYVFTIIDGKVARTKVETGRVTFSNIEVTGLTGNEEIIQDVRGLKEGDLVAQ